MKWYQKTHFIALCLICLGLALSGGDCGGDKGSTGATGAAGTATVPINTAIGEAANFPGCVITITGLTGGTGANGNFNAGNTMAVQFTVKTTAGANIPLEELNSVTVTVSGPTTRYQKILPAGNSTSYSIVSTTNGVVTVATTAVKQTDGSYIYTIPDAIPSVYPAQRNASTAFGTQHGELEGQTLQSGTYTAGMRAYKYYYINGTQLRDVGNATKDFLMGTATTLAPRAVVTDTNCNSCHTQLRLHGGGYRTVKMCVLCHTAGAENGAHTFTMDFRQMIHKIHSGKNLPSVNGITTPGTSPASDGSTYGAGVPFQWNSTNDFSKISFPNRMGNNYHQMPNDAGYSGLVGGASVTGTVSFTSGSTAVTGSGTSFTTQLTTNHYIRLNDGGSPVKIASIASNTALTLVSNYSYTGSGTASFGDSVAKAWRADQKHVLANKGALECTKCHDGSTTEGKKYYTQPSFSACQSCHDDWTYNTAYKTMDPVPDDGTGSSCATSTCHGETATRNAKDVHIPPILKSTVWPGVNIVVNSVDNGTDNTNVAVNSKVRAKFTIKNDAGTDLTASEIYTSSSDNYSMNVVMNGPTTNRQYLIYQSIPTNALPTPVSSVYTMNIPTQVYYVEVGASTATNNEAISTGTYTATYGAHWNYQTGTAKITSMLLATIPGADDGTLNANASVGDTYIDVTVTGTAPATDKYIVIDQGGAGREFLKIYRWEQKTTGPTTGRIWLAPIYRTGYIPLRKAHLSGVGFRILTTASKGEGSTPNGYTVDYSTGAVTEVGELGTGVILLSYYTDYKVPTTYGPALFYDPADIFDATWGNWAGKSVENGTYTFGTWMYKYIFVKPNGTLDTGADPDQTRYRVTSKPGRKDFLMGTATTIDSNDLISSSTNCESCHGDFGFHGGSRRGFQACQLCHGIVASAFDIMSTTTAKRPGETVDFRTFLHKVHSGAELAKKDTYFGGIFKEFEFPVFDNKVKECSKCHGTNTSYLAPKQRVHSTGGTPTRVYRAACGSCHDSDSASAHFDLMTASSGYEACQACHGSGHSEGVDIKHKTR